MDLCDQRSLVMRAALVVSLVASGSVTALAKPKVAVLGIEPVARVGTLDKDTVRVADDLTLGLRVRARTGLAPHELAPGSERDLADEKQANQCESELPACMAKIGVALNADLVLYGRLELKTIGFTTGYQLSLKLLDVARRRVQVSWSDFIPRVDINNPQRLTEWARKGYDRLAGFQPTAPAPPAPPTCELDNHIARGNIHLANGEYMPALVAYETALACRHDDAVLVKAFVMACRARHVVKAKALYKKLPASKQHLAQICVRHHVDATSP